MKHAALTEKQQYWLSHIRACERAGIPIADYARQHDLDKKRFYNWKWLLAKRELLEVENENVSFTQVRLDHGKSAGGEMALYFPNGCQMILGDLSHDRLREIVQTLVQA